MAEQPPSVRTWLVIVGLSVGPAVSNGFARFAYGLILPAMQADLGWSFSQAGWINTANAIGYLVGALLALRYMHRIGVTRTFVGGMLLTAFALLMSGMTTDLALLTVYRIAAGIGGAPVFIAGGVLASTLFAESPTRNALAIAVYFGGGGIGMLLTGLFIPPSLEASGASSWPQVWWALGLASLACFLPSLWATRKLRHDNQDAGHSAGAALTVTPMMPALMAYFMFGVGYFVYMTFLVAWMREQGQGVDLVVLTWTLLSLMVIVSPFIWRGALARSAAGGAIALTMLFTGLGSLVPLLHGGANVMLLSAVLFGGAFFMVPTAVTSFSKKNLPAPQWGPAVSLFTTLFAVGQMIGPAAAGLVADWTSSLAPGLAASGAVLVIGAALALLQRPLPVQQGQ